MAEARKQAQGGDRPALKAVGNRGHQTGADGRPESVEDALRAEDVLTDEDALSGRTARGRHAPPPEVRLPLQRRRLMRAAAAEFAERGYVASSAASITRRAGMSKATFYAHFDNKEDCLLAMYDRANEVIGAAMADAAQSAGTRDATARFRAAARAFLKAVTEHPQFARVLVMEIIAAGPAAVAKRDQAMQLFAGVLDAENALAARRGLSPRFASRHDAFAIVGGITELVSRHVRQGIPKDIAELAPVIDRMIDGMLARAGS